MKSAKSIICNQWTM